MLKGEVECGQWVVVPDCQFNGTKRAANSDDAHSLLLAGNEDVDDMGMCV